MTSFESPKKTRHTQTHTVGNPVTRERGGRKTRSVCARLQLLVRADADRAPFPGHRPRARAAGRARALAAPQTRGPGPVPGEGRAERGHLDAVGAPRVQRLCRTALRSA